MSKVTLAMISIKTMDLTQPTYFTLSKGAESLVQDTIEAGTLLSVTAFVDAIKPALEQLGRVKVVTENDGVDICVSFFDENTESDLFLAASPNIHYFMSAVIGVCDAVTGEWSFSQSQLRYS